MAEQNLKHLFQESREALKHSYCPYSNFPVGAALLGTNGTIYKGCNIENCAHSGAICAERTAMVKAISEGQTSFEAIAITSNMKDHYCSPCGVCRQFMAEFGTDLKIYMVRPDLSFQMTTLDKLLPMSFGPKDLSYERLKNEDSNHL